MAKASTPASRMSRYRSRLRAQGLRPVQIWAPDTRSGKVAEELRRQSKLVSRRKSERETIALIDAIGASDETW
jgi:hypothetical protein